MTDLTTLKAAAREAEVAKRKAEDARLSAWEAFRVYVSPKDSPAAAAAGEAWRAAVTSSKMATVVAQNASAKMAAARAEEAWGVAKIAEKKAWNVAEAAWAVAERASCSLKRNDEVKAEAMNSADVADKAWRASRVAEWEAWHVLEEAWGVERQTRAKLKDM